MDASRFPFDNLLAQAKGALDALTRQLGPDPAAALGPLRALGLVPRQEFEQVKAQVAELERQLRSLESRLEDRPPRDLP